MSEEKALALIGSLQKGWEMMLEGVPTALIIDKLGLNEVQFLKFVNSRSREIAERDRALEKAVVLHKQDQLLKVAMKQTDGAEPNLEWARFALDVLKEQRAVVLQAPVSSRLPYSEDTAEYDSEKVGEALKKIRLKGKKVEDAEEGTD